MPNWQGSFFDHLSGPPRRTVEEAVIDIGELRRRYNYLTDRFGSVPSEASFEPGVLGPVRGEWTRTAHASPERVVVYFHGGGYISGSPETHRALISRLALTAEANIFTPAYRLAPEYAFPAAVRDGLDTYRQLLSGGVQPQSIVLAGNGSGGGLALSVLLAIRNANQPMPAALAVMSPWADLTLSGWSILRNAQADVTLSWELLFVSARHYLKRANPADLYASPLFASFKGFPPLMIHAGNQEILRDDASRLGDRAAESGVPVSIEIYDGMPHVFQAYSQFPEAKVSLQRLGQFIKNKILAASEAAGRHAGLAR